MASQSGSLGTNLSRRFGGSDRPKVFSIVSLGLVSRFSRKSGSTAAFDRISWSSSLKAWFDIASFLRRSRAAPGERESNRRARLRPEHVLDGFREDCDDRGGAGEGGIARTLEM